MLGVFLCVGGGEGEVLSFLTYTEKKIIHKESNNWEVKISLIHINFFLEQKLSN